MLELDLVPNFLQDVLPCPVRARLVAMVMLIAHLAVAHEVVLVAACRVDLQDAVIAVWDVREQPFEHVHDVYTRKESAFDVGLLMQGGPGKRMLYRRGLWRSCCQARRRRLE